MKRALSNYRWSLIGVMAVVLMVVAVACGDDATPTSPPPTSTPTATAMEPTATAMAMEPTATAMAMEPTATAMAMEPTAMPEPTEAMMMEGKPGGVIPMQSLCGPNFQMIHLASFCGQIHASPVYNNIVELNPETPDPLDIRGDLAVDWSVSDDSLTYTFNLNPDAMWQDGQPVTAEDAAFSMQLFTDPGSISEADYPALYEETLGSKRSGRGGDLATYLASSRAVDANTVELTLNFPSGAFLLVLAADELAVLPKHQLDAGVIPSFRDASTLMGSGPFLMKEYKDQVSTTHERNPNYFKEGRPYVDELQHFPITDKASIIGGYRVGQFLMGDSLRNGLNVVQVTELQNEISDRATVHWSPAGGMAVMMNARVEPFDDARVRRAMILVFHRQPIIETVTLDRAVIGSPFAPDQAWSYPLEDALQLPGLRESSPGVKDQRDIDEAKRLVEEAGYGDGYDVTLACLNAEEYCQVSVILKDQLNQYLGWNVDIEQGEVAPLWARYLEGDYQFASQAFSCSIPDPDGCLSTWAKGGQRATQLTGHYNMDAQPLWEAQQQEADPAKRQALMQQISDFLLEDSTESVLYHSQLSWIVDNRIHNFNIPNTSGSHKKHEHLWCDPAC